LLLRSSCYSSGSNVAGWLQSWPLTGVCGCALVVVGFALRSRWQKYTTMPPMTRPPTTPTTTPIMMLIGWLVNPVLQLIAVEVVGTATLPLPAGLVAVTVVVAAVVSSATNSPNTSMSMELQIVIASDPMVWRSPKVVVHWCN
jgi:hypothetical protein